MKKGHIEITGARQGLSTQITVWVDVFRPIVHVEVKSNKSVHAEATFESWRYIDRITEGLENNSNSYKWAPPAEVVTLKD